MVFLNKVFLQKITCKTIDFLIAYLQVLVNQVNPSPPNPGRREKIKVNFYFHTSLWCLKRFYESSTKKCENKNLT